MYEIKIPKFGLTMEKGHIERWLKKEGDSVKKGDSLLEVSSDKISNEITSPVSGILLKIIGLEGEEYPVGHIIGIIGEKDERYEPDKTGKEEIVKTTSAIPSKDKESVQEIGDRRAAQPVHIIKASPLAKKMAKEHGITLSQVSGSGPGGRIVKKDILLFGEQLKKDDFMVKKLSGLRKTMIDRLSRSYHQAITLTNMSEVDFTELKKHTKSMGVSITSGLILLVCRVLLSLKQFNSHFEENQLKEYTAVNIGLAVDTERGLLVPVLKNTETLTINNIQEKLKSLSAKAKENELTEEDLQGSTFTITNLGMMRTDFFTPVLNPPEVAILGVGRIVKKPCVVDEDKISIREMAYLSLSYDHRVIDGADAARFLEKLAHYIESPDLL